ncbi:MAG: TonB-dependent receptor, partial [Pedobacter sp.]
YFLENSLKRYDVGYRIVKDQILLYSIPANNNLELLKAFDGVVTGKVLDSKGNPIPGVSVTVKGKTIGTTTDENGNFALKGLTVDSRVLVVRYVGFISKEVNLSAGNADENISISLSEDNLQLESVMVTGGNPKKKLESSVALTSVSSKDITNRAPLNSTDLLKAIPGLTVESTGGDGPGNVWVRGFPQQGGYIFLGIQEDGLPLLPTGFNTNPSVDQYYKTDLTIQNIEAIRGGNAAIIQANTPGAVVNNLSYVGADKQYGQVKFTTGFSQGLYRFDGNTGGKINDQIKYNIGGFYRTDNGVVDQGFNPANRGGQVKGNMTFNFKNNKGFFRVYGKYLNDKVQFLLTSYYPYDGTGKPTTYRDYNMANQSITPVQTDWSYNDPTTGVHDFTLKDGIHTKLGSAGFQFNYLTDGGWQIVNNFRYQNTHTNSTYTAPAGITARTAATPYYYPGGSVAPFVSGDYVVTSNAQGQINSDVQVVNYLDLKKTIKNHSLNIGAGIHQYNRDDLRFGFRSFTEFKEHPSIILQSPTAPGRTATSKNTFIGDTRTLSLYAGDEIKISDQWRLDIGAREVGFKYAKNNLAIFASGSYSSIKNVSLSINVPTVSAGQQALVAFGSTRTFSAEYEISYKIAKPLSLRLTGTLQDSKYTDYEANTSGNAAVAAEFGNRVYSFTGNRTERVPVLNTELGANYDYKNFNLYVAANYVGSRYTSPSESYKLPGYVVMKAGAGYNFNKKIAIRFWADNLLDAKVLTEGDVRGDQFRDFSTVTPGQLMIGRTLLQRTFWGSLAYSF